MEQPYRPPAPFAPPSMRTAPLNELAVYGRSTYPHPPMLPQPVAPPPPPVAGHWQPGAGWVPVGHRRVAARRRTVLTVAALSLALLAVIGALAIGRAGPSGHTLSLPESAGSYVRISTLSSDHVRSLFGSAGAFGAIPAADLAKARIGVYGLSGSQGSPRALFVGFSAADSPDIGRQLHAEASDQVTSDVLASGGAPVGTVVDAGPFGGSLRCGTAHVSGLFASIGVWADTDTLGLVLVFDPSLGPSVQQMGQVTRAFRARAEH